MATDNPFLPDRAYTVPEFCKRAALGRTTAYEHLKAGDLHARRLGTRRTLITNAFEWFEALPAYRPGARSYQQRRA